MALSRVGSLLCLLVTVLGAVACTTPEQSATIATTSDKIAIGPDLGGPELDSDAAFAQEYAFRRVYPRTSLTLSDHANALTAMTTLRADLGIDEFDPASNDCNPACVAPNACLSGYCAVQCNNTTAPCASPTVARRSNSGCWCVPPTSVGTPLPATGCGWTPIGPVNVSGRVNALAFDPKNPNRLFAGSVGGLWRSEDKGRNWSRVVVGSGSMVTSASSRIRSLEFNPTSGELFVGTGDELFGGDGIWMSSSGTSGSFTKITDGQLDNLMIERMRSPPTSVDTLYVASRKGVYVGTRSNATWSWQVFGGMNLPVTDLVVNDQVSPPIMYAAVVDTPPKVSGVYRFDSQTWQPSKLTFPDSLQVKAVKLAMAASNRNILLAKVVDGTTTTIYKTTTAGIDQNGNPVPWTALPSTFTSEFGDSGRIDGDQPDYNSVIELDPNDPNTVYVGGVNIYGSKDGGATFIRHSVPSVHDQPHLDVHAVVFEPTTTFASKHVVYVGTDGGVSVSGDTTDPKWLWYERSHGMQTGEFYRFGAQPGLASTFGGGLQDNGTLVTSGGRNWFGPNQCDGTVIAFDATNASFYEQCQGNLYQMRNRMWQTADNNDFFALTTYLNVDPSQNARVALAQPSVPVIIATDPTITRTSIVQGEDTRDLTKQVILKSTDAQNWVRLSLDLPSNEWITALGITPGSQTNKQYYAITQNTTASEGQAEVYVSDDSGATWRPPVFLPAAWVAGLAIDPGNAGRASPKRVWVAAGEGVLFESDDGGGNWHDVPIQPGGQSLPPAVSVTGIAVDPTSNGTVFLATDVGVLRGVIDASGATSWEPYSTGLPNGVDVNAIVINPDASALAIGTFGNGAFRRNYKETTCADSKLIVRDTAYDTGQSPSPNDLPNPEWMIEIPPAPGVVEPFPFFKADDRDGERVYFFESPDIRTGVPSQRDAAAAACPAALGQSCTIDSVEFDSWPLEIDGSKSYFRDFLVDARPTVNVPATVHVQVSNIGVARSSNVRVVAVYANASTGVPTLPTDFWGSNKVLPGGDCTKLSTSNTDLGGGWRVAGCQMLADVAPGVPEVATMKWTPPADTNSHSCMVAIVDSPTDQVTPSLSMTNVEQLAQLDRHVAQRNLHIEGTSALTAAAQPPAPTTGTVDGQVAPGVPFEGVTTLNVPNRWNPGGSAKVLFATGHLGNSGRLAFLLPTGKTAPGLPPACGGATNSATNVAISLPKAVVTNDVALSANGTIDIADRGVTVLDASGGGGGQIVNSGTGQTTIGASAKVGTISAVGGVFLRSNSSVLGDVNLDGTFNQQTGVVISGKVNKGAPLTPADAVGWSVTWPSTSLGNIDVNTGQVTKAPGRYGTVSVKPGATLVFSGGVYYLDSLTLETGSTLTLDQSSGPTTLYTRQGVTIRGLVKSAQSKPTDLLIIAMGTAPVVVESSLSGSIVAPQAPLTLGSNGGTYSGTYYAHDLTIRADVHIQQATSGAWSGVPACRALTPAEKTTVTAAGLSPTLYPAQGVGPKQVLPIPFGQTWTLGVRYDVGRGISGASSRFRVLSLDPQDKVVAGGTYLLRH